MAAVAAGSVGGAGSAASARGGSGAAKRPGATSAVRRFVAWTDEGVEEVAEHLPHRRQPVIVHHCPPPPSGEHERAARAARVANLLAFRHPKQQAGATAPAGPPELQPRNAEVEAALFDSAVAQGERLPALGKELWGVAAAEEEEVVASVPLRPRGMCRSRCRSPTAARKISPSRSPNFSPPSHCPSQTTPTPPPPLPHPTTHLLQHTAGLTTPTRQRRGPRFADFRSARCQMAPSHPASAPSSSPSLTPQIQPLYGGSCSGANRTPAPLPHACFRSYRPPSCCPFRVTMRRRCSPSSVHHPPYVHGEVACGRSGMWRRVARGGGWHVVMVACGNGWHVAVVGICSRYVTCGRQGQWSTAAVVCLPSPAHPQLTLRTSHPHALPSLLPCPSPPLGWRPRITTPLPSALRLLSPRLSS